MDNREAAAGFVGENRNGRRRKQHVNHNDGTPNNQTTKPKRQQHLDFTRGEQGELLRKACLPSVVASDGGKVKDAVLKSVLKSIDYFGRGREAFPTVQTIAADVGYSVRHVKRAIEALEALSLIIKRKKARRTADGRWATPNHYRIVWTELALLVQSRTDRSATLTDRSATLTDRSATSGTQKRQETRKEPPPPTPSTVDGNWSEVEAALSACELKTAGETVCFAQQHGYAPAELLEAIATYQANKDKLRSPRAIYFWVTHDRHWPAEGVRDAQAIEVAKRARQEKRAAERTEYEAEQRRALVEQERLSALEETYGPLYEAMSDEQRVELAMACFKTDWEFNRWRRGDTHARHQVLLAIQDNESHAPN